MEAIEVRVRSTPTPFGGRQSPFGFIPDSEFVSLTLTPLQIAELQKNKDLYSEIGSGAENIEAARKLAFDASAALAVEVKKHNETKAALQVALAQVQSMDLEAKKAAYLSDVALAASLNSTELTLTKARLAKAEADLAALTAPSEKAKK